MTTNRKGRLLERGFTLVEMIVVIAIIGVLATIVVIKYAGQTDQAKVATAKAHLAQLESAVISFQANTGRIPASLTELIEKPSIAVNWQEGGYLKGKSVPKDPWGHDYVYKTSGRKFEIICLGADGLEGGEGADADISNEGSDPGK
jgi:general secretion pathway protein G